MTLTPLSSDSDVSQKPLSLSSLLAHELGSFPDEGLTVHAFLQRFSDRSLAMLIFFIALPLAFGVAAIPAVNSLFSIPLILLTLQQVLGKTQCWMPKMLDNKIIEKQTVDKLIHKVLPFINKAERIMRPRLFFITHAHAQRLIGVVGLIFSFYLFIPMPFANTVPSFGLLFMAAGLLMRDGLLILIGMVGGLIWVSALTLISLHFGDQFLTFIKDFL
jgi:hypothetical protein